MGQDELALVGLHRENDSSFSQGYYDAKGKWQKGLRHDQIPSASRCCMANWSSPTTRLRSCAKRDWMLWRTRFLPLANAGSRFASVSNSRQRAESQAGASARNLSAKGKYTCLSAGE